MAGMLAAPIALTSSVTILKIKPDAITKNAISVLLFIFYPFLLFRPVWHDLSITTFYDMNATFFYTYIEENIISVSASACRLNMLLIWIGQNTVF
tara:strand:+ start:396 stop:680 length:285 start_codon:yes stop_codon:yes gene_type:complete